MDNIILFSDSSRGVYIPQYFAESVCEDALYGISGDDLNILKAGPNGDDESQELYWEVWEECLNGATVRMDGREYTLYQDGDLWLIDMDNATAKEKREMFDIETYDREELVSELEDVPTWIEQDITLGDVESIQQGGCASGAYMPAVTYHQAKETMNEYGDDVLDYINDHMGELPKPSDNESWSGIAVFYLSMAVELWTSSIDLDEIDLDG